MSNIVFLSPNTGEPFTTSKVIANMTGINHRRIKDAIRKHLSEIESIWTFGRICDRKFWR